MTECIEVALLGEEKQAKFENELLAAIRQDSDCFEQAKNILLFAKAYKNIKLNS